MQKQNLNTRRKTHSFDIEIAQAFGLNCATLIYHLDFWISHNKANNKNFYDGYYWTYNTREAFSEQLPYLTPKQVRDALKKLIDAGLVIKGCYNENPFDRTAWYALTEAYYSFRLNDANPSDSTDHSPRTSESATSDYMVRSYIGITDIERTDIETDLKTKDAREALNTQEPSRVHKQTKTQSSPICQKPFFETSDFQTQDNITQADLDYLNTFSNSLTQEQEKYKRELGLFIIHRKTHKKHANLSELALRQLITKLKGFSSLKSIKEALIESVINGWAGVFEPKQTKGRFEYNTYNEYDTGDNSIYLRHALGIDKNDNT